jgi:predicted TIM-barrel fold metal-dependent hydrolase
MQLFDSHLHIIDPRFPLVANNGYLPEPFTCDDYLARMEEYDLRGGAVVSGSFQGFDQEYLLSALKTLGPSFVGVTNLPVTVTDEEIIALHKAGVRAIRFNLVRGGSAQVTQLETLAKRVHELCNWHIELYVSAKDLAGLYNRLVKLPRICIDHLGLTHNGFTDLLKLVDKGAYVKASGFGRVDFEIAPALKQIHSTNSQALVFGTDLPSTRAPRAYHINDLNLLIESLGEPAAQQVLFNNAVNLYQPASYSEN